MGYLSVFLRAFAVPRFYWSRTVWMESRLGRGVGVLGVFVWASAVWLLGVVSGLSWAVWGVSSVFSKDFTGRLGAVFGGL